MAGRTAPDDVTLFLCLPCRRFIAKQLPICPGLGDLLLEQGRIDAAERLIADLETKAEEPDEALMFRARILIARKEYNEAHKLLQGACSKDPRSLRPRVLLSHTLILSQNWDAAETALREILTLAPDHAEAKRNLHVLLRQQGRPVPG